jgi:hypothetical protein
LATDATPKVEPLVTSEFDVNAPNQLSDEYDAR